MTEYRDWFIPNIEAKDLWLESHMKETNSVGYSLHKENGEFNLKKFEATFNSSLDMAKLEKVFYSVYHRNCLCFYRKHKWFSKYVLSMDFNYSVKEFNQAGKNVLIRVGYRCQYSELGDGYCVRDGKLIAIRLNTPLSYRIPDELLGEYFSCLEFGGDAEPSRYIYSERKNKTLVTIKQLREWAYREGVKCDGVSFVRWKRSNGSSRLGRCLFLDKALYPLMYKWQCCGLNPEAMDNIDLAAFEAYIGLTLSTMIGSVSIFPENILVIKDYESVFNETAIVTRDIDNQLHSKVEDTKISNKIWDGQSLMDSSLFAEYPSKGMLLLRNRFFKSCCFNTNIQEWFKDQGITDVKQLNGYTLAKDVSDIKLITTPSSIKYLKFGELRRWLDRLEPTFGIVKFEKPTHYFDGRMVSTHYQLLNTLQLSEEEVQQFLQPSIDYLRLLESDPAVLKHHIKYKVRDEIVPFLCQKNDTIYNMMSITDKFCSTKLYEDFKIDLLKSIKTNMCKGRVWVDGTYSTLFGNPVEMLQFAIDKYNGESQIGTGNVYTKFFPFGTNILCSRSPHVCASNIYLANNATNPEIDKYFNLSENIIAVNSVGESLLDRLSGSDFDSDTCLITDNKILIEAAKRNYDKFLVPINAVNASKTIRRYCCEDETDLDIRTSTNKIGEIINLAQVLTTIYWNRINAGATFESVETLYNDIVTLDILSNIEIDKAKKEFLVDSASEIDKIRQRYVVVGDDGRTIVPKFLGFIAKTKGYYNSKKKKYTYHCSSMDYIQRVMSKVRFKREGTYTPFSALLEDASSKMPSPNYRQRNAIIGYLRETRADVAKIWECTSYTIQHKMALYDEVFLQRVKFISNFDCNISTVRLLVASIERKQFCDCRRDLFLALFNSQVECFYKALKKSRTIIQQIEPDVAGDIDIFGVTYSYNHQNS